MTKDKALRMALEALDQLTNVADTFSVSGVYLNEELWAKKCLSDAYFAITTIEEALSSPNGEALAKQEQGAPVAEVKRNSSGQIYIEWRDGESAIANLIDAKLYTTPQPAQKPYEILAMQVRPSEFAELIKGNETVTGIPAYWAEWPNKEKP